MEAETGETRMRLDAKHESAGRHGRRRMNPPSGCQEMRASSKPAIRLHSNFRFRRADFTQTFGTAQP